MRITFILLTCVAVLSATNAIKKFIISRIDLNISGVEHVQAITNYTLSELPLYTQYMIDNRRRSHMEIGNMAMVGCFMSHLSIWERMNMSGDVVLVLEEDALLDLNYDTRIDMILESTGNTSWDVIMLTSRMWGVAKMNTVALNDYLYRCQTKKGCDWFGTRGYLLHPNAIPKLLANVFPIVVQVDAFLSLMNSYHPNFVMLWSVQEVVHESWFHLSSIWDMCLVCFVTEEIIAYVVILSIVYHLLKTKLRSIHKVDR